MLAALIWSVVLGFIWWVGTGFSLPTPIEILKAWVDLIQNGMLYDLLAVSFRLNVEGILISTFISLILAYIAVEKKFSYPAKTLAALRFLGMAGFSIVLQRWLGGGHALKVGMLVAVMTPFMTTSMLDVVNSVPEHGQEMYLAQTLKMGKVRAIFEVIILGKLQQTFEAIIQNAAIGWMSITLIEGLVKFEGGIGAMMLNEVRYRSLAPVFALQLTACLVGLLQDKVLKTIKNLVTREGV